MSYNYCNRYSILSYMEYPILLFQEYILIYLVLKYKGQLDSNAYKFAGAYFFALSMFLTNIIPTFILAMLVVSCNIIIWCCSVRVTVNLIHPFLVHTLYSILCSVENASKTETPAQRVKLPVCGMPKVHLFCQI